MRRKEIEEDQLHTGMLLKERHDYTGWQLHRTGVEGQCPILGTLRFTKRKKSVCSVTKTRDIISVNIYYGSFVYNCQLGTDARVMWNENLRKQLQTELMHLQQARRCEIKIGIMNRAENAGLSCERSTFFSETSEYYESRFRVQNFVSNSTNFEYQFLQGISRFHLQMNLFRKRHCLFWYVY